MGLQFLPKGSCQLSHNSCSSCHSVGCIDHSTFFTHHLNIVFDLSSLPSSKGLLCFLTGKDLMLKSYISPAFCLRLILARYFPFQNWTKVAFISTPNRLKIMMNSHLLVVQRGIHTVQCHLFWCELGILPSWLTASLWHISHSSVGVFNCRRANVFRTGVYRGLESWKSWYSVIALSTYHVGDCLFKIWRD